MEMSNTATIHLRTTTELQLQQLVAQVIQLQADVQALKLKVFPATEAKEVTVEPAINLVEDEFTYLDAFQQGGGESAVEKYSEISDAVAAQAVPPQLTEELQELFLNCSKRGFSTVLVNQPFVSDLEQLYELAQRALPVFNNFVSRVASDTQGKAQLDSLKTHKRALAKATFKYNDGTGVAWYRLTDLVRGTIAYLDIEMMYLALNFLAKKCKVREFNDRFRSPLDGGYRDLQLVVEIDGYLCELQLTTEAFLRAKTIMGHRDYELIRELQAAVEAGELKTCQEAFQWAHTHLGSHRQQTVLSTPEGAMLLHKACKKGFVDIALCLIKSKCDPNTQDRDGNTGLHLAMKEGHERTVWALLSKHKVDFSLQNKEGQTALMMGYLSFRISPEERRARALSTLAHFAGLEHVRETRQRIDAEIAPRIQNSSHLVDFAREGRVEKMSVELRHFANPDSKRDDQCALVAAVQGNQVLAVELLLKYKPSEESLEQALALAVAKNSWECAELLVSSHLPLALQEVLTAAATHQAIPTIKRITQHEVSQPIRESAILAALGAKAWRSIEALLTFPPSSSIQVQILVNAYQQHTIVRALFGLVGVEINDLSQVFQQLILCASGIDWDSIVHLLSFGPPSPETQSIVMVEAAKRGSVTCIQRILQLSPSSDGYLSALQSAFEARQYRAAQVLAPHVKQVAIDAMCADITLTPEVAASRVHFAEVRVQYDILSRFAREANHQFFHTWFQPGFELSPLNPTLQESAVCELPASLQSALILVDFVRWGSCHTISFERHPVTNQVLQVLERAIQEQKGTTKVVDLGSFDGSVKLDDVRSFGKALAASKLEEFVVDSVKIPISRIQNSSWPSIPLNEPRDAKLLLILWTLLSTLHQTVEATSASETLAVVSFETLNSLKPNTNYALRNKVQRF